MQYSDDPFFLALKSGKLLRCDSAEMMKEIFDYMIDNGFPIGSSLLAFKTQFEINKLFSKFHFIGYSRFDPVVTCFLRPTKRRSEVISYDDFLNITGLNINIDVDEMALLLRDDFDNICCASHIIS